jgi:spore coat polysaccharide biosynthesis protein SpsF
LVDDLLIVLTARVGSDRLRGKVVAPVSGRPLLAWLVERLKPLGELVVATTQLPEDDVVERVAGKTGVACYRHPDPDDVTGRVWAVLRRHPARYCLRALGDCPFIEPVLVARSVEVMSEARADLFCWTGDNVGQGGRGGPPR